LNSQGQLIFELVATSKELRKQRRLPLQNGDVVCIGRQPKDGWAVPWDSKISREHLELVVKNGKVQVRQLETAQNEIHFKGKVLRKFTATAGEPFRIGLTTFQIEQVSELKQKFGDRFAGHRIQTEMGEGPLGKLIGVNAPTGESIAMKIISPSLLPNALAEEDCLEKAKAISTLRALGIGYVYDAGTEAGHLWMSREFVHGTPLHDVLKGRTMPRQKALETVEQIARNLGNLHEAGHCHLNLKPSNVIYRSGATWLVDVSPVGSLYSLVASGKVSDGVEGIVNYLAPEVAESTGAADIRSDLYSLGCLWFEMLTGSPPFPNGTADLRVKSHAKVEPRWKLVADAGLLDSELDVLRRLLSKKPEQRFATPAALLDELSGSDVKGSFVDCLGCHKRYRIKPQLIGKKVRCKKCGGTISIE